MKNIFAFLLAMSLSILPLFAQKKNAIGIKPINLSNLDLGDSDDGFIGRHFGIEYERVISKDDKWPIALPLTFGWLKTLYVTDYDRTGYDFYITPGINSSQRISKNQGVELVCKCSFGPKEI